MLLFTVLLCLFQYNSAAIVRLNESEYALMPALVHLDPYEECLQNPDAVYCFAQFELVSDTPSPLLDMIQAYSHHYYTHFNHTKLRYGVCVTETCKEIHGTNKDQKQVLEACFNETLWNSHRLKTRMTNEYYCNVHKRKLETGVWDIIIAGVFVAIILANIAGSLYHYRYGDQEQGAVARFLLAFSFKRNWKTFITILPHTDQRLAQMQSIHGLRAILCILVIVVHVGYPYNYIFPENPHFVEKMYDRNLNRIFFSGHMMMTTFFILSACLLIYNCLIYEKLIRKLTWTAAPILIVRRLLRVTPPYALLLGLISTWFRFLPAGPLYQHIVGNNSEACRKYWWRHLLFINNYFDDSDCMTHTWYLAADIQLYCLGVVFFLTCKSTRLRNRALMTLIAVGLIIPALVAYFKNLDPILIANPESLATMLRDHRYFNELHKRGHTNLAACSLGIGMGYLIYDWQKRGLNGQSFYKYRNANRLLWVFAILVMYSGSIYYGERPTDPDYFSVLLLHAYLLKPVFMLITAVCFLGIIFRIEYLMSTFLEWRPWVYLSRLSYGAYLNHMMCMRALSVGINHTVYLTDVTLIYLCLKTLVFSLALALLFWLLVEEPAKILSHELLNSAENNKKKEVNEDSAAKLETTDISAITKKDK